jgi:hypothetical protein
MSPVLDQVRPSETDRKETVRFGRGFYHSEGQSSSALEPIVNGIGCLFSIRERSLRGEKGGEVHRVQWRSGFAFFFGFGRGCGAFVR